MKVWADGNFVDDWTARSRRTRRARAPQASTRPHSNTGVWRGVRAGDPGELEGARRISIPRALPARSRSLCGRAM